MKKTKLIAATSAENIKIPDHIFLSWLLEYLEIHPEKNEHIRMELFTRPDTIISGDSNEQSKL